MDNLNFDKMGIYDLRNYARSIGVHSPTTLKRQELIACINAIIEGVKEPEKPKDGRGRPPKHKVDDMYMLDMFVPDNLFNIDPNDYRYKPFGQSNFAKSYSATTFCQSNNIDGLDMAFDGYFVKKTENYGLILKKGYKTEYFKENVIILKDEMEKFALKNGDFVEGACVYIKDRNLMLAKDVLKINGNEFNKLERQTFENLKIQYPSKMIDLSVDNNYINAKIINKICPVAFGGRVAINFDRTDEHVDFIGTLLNSIEKNNVTVSMISVDDSIEDIVAVESLCSNLNVCKYNSTLSREQYFEKIDLLFENMCRRIECGQNVVAVIYDCQNLLENIQNDIALKMKYDIETAMIYAENKLKDLFGLARATENGSLTVIGFNLQNQKVLSVCNCQIQILGKPYSKTDVSVDVQNSYTKNVQKIISKEEFVKLQNFKNNVNEQNVLSELELLFEGEE